MWAVDHDLQALQATENNAALNSFVDEDNLTIVLPEKLPAIKSPLIIANILANPLIENASCIMALASSPATLVLSGILEPEIDRVASAYASAFSLESVSIKEGWVQLTLSTLE